MKWIKQNRDIKPGEIIRTKFKKGEALGVWDMEKEKERDKTNRIHVFPDGKIKFTEDQYIYGIARGGFGLSWDTRGNAIFVDNIDNDYETTKNNKGKYSGRWERYWGIEIIEG